MSTPTATACIEELTKRAKARAVNNDPTSLKQAFSSVLKEIKCKDAPSAFKDGTDVLGLTYMRLLSNIDRRTLGQVFTPMWVAHVMAGWALKGTQNLVMDPGCGSGVLSIAAARIVKPGISIVGIDNDPTAILMTKINARLREYKIELLNKDFLLDSIEGQPTAILCNPPYTRHHSLSQEQKDLIAETLGTRLGLKHTRQASLHALFLARALEIAATGARIAFITPAHWLETRYGREVRDYLEGLAYIVGVVNLNQNLFPNASTSAAITLVEKTKNDGRQPFHMEVPAITSDPKDILDEIARRECRVKPVAIKRNSKASVRLGELASVHRGVATGHNHFFVLSDARRKMLQLNKSYLVPCTSSPRHFQGTILTMEMLEEFDDDVPRWLLVPKSPGARGPLARYLQYGKEIGVDQRRLAKQRAKWYSIGWTRDFGILFSYLNKENPRFVKNEANAVPLNNWLVVEPREGVDANELFERVSDVRVLNNSPKHGRHYGNGLWKLEPSELEDLIIPKL